jgi:glycosyltransferase involved in cell wall biosynthesis
MQQLFKADKIFCLSEWHRSFFLQTYPFLHPGTVIKTKNGLDLRRFEKTPKKEGNRLIFASSPDRGLELMLHLMPRIRAEVPDARLHIYYGFDNWKKAANLYNNQHDKDLIANYERLIREAEQRGDVTFHGRVNQKELAEAYMSSKVWTYPTAFTETSCISAMESQASACVPVSTVLAALPETVSHGFLIRPPNSAPEYQDTFVKRVVNLLKDDAVRSDYAAAGREFAFLNHGWDLVAKSWVKHFEDVIAKKSENPLPAFGDM